MEKCRICNAELVNIPYANEFRRVGYCHLHIPEEIKCKHANCQYPVQRNKEYCKSHRAYAKRKHVGKVRCSGTTVRGRRCRNLVHPELVYCPAHRNQESIKPLRAKDYSKYINSSGWHSKSSAKKQEFDNRCRLCNRKLILHSHHRSYERLGVEHKNDLVPLCKMCHKLFHDHFEYNSRKHEFWPK